METPLNAREFLKRFHLPQLVRISSSTAPGEAADSSPAVGRQQPPAAAPATTRQVSDEQHERSDDWTYRAAGELNGFCSLAPTTRAADSSPPTHRCDSKRFHSISDWSAMQTRDSSSQNNKQQDADRSGKSPSRGQFGYESELANTNQTKTDFGPPKRALGDSIRLMPPSKRPAQSKLELGQPFLLYKAYKKLELCAYSIDPNNQLNEKSGAPIYFPQNYPASRASGSERRASGAETQTPTIRHQISGYFNRGSSSSSATVVELSGELTGWFSLAIQEHDQDRWLDSIDQVCMAGYSQVFLTRDELIAYRLPAKLSHLTKLKNNQLLALPLAISLAASSASASGKSAKLKCKKNGSYDQQQSSSQEKDNKSAGSSSISDLKRVIIQSGQVLKICGIYEDVMPLIESNQPRLKSAAAAAAAAHRPHNGKHKQQHDMPQFFQSHHHSNQRPQVIHFDPHRSIHCQQVALQAPPIGPPPQQQQLLYGNLVPQIHMNGYNSSNNNDDEKFHLPRVQHKAHSGDANQLQQEIRRLKKSGSKAAADAIYCQRAALPSQCRGQAAPLAPPESLRPAGQRYARCMVLSQDSVNRMVTNSRLLLAGGAGEQSSQATNIGADSDSEVLIPIEQVGRFYMCAATSSDLLHASSSRECRSRLVFRLSQVMSLLGMSRKLANTCQAADCRRPLASEGAGVTLPLIAHLVIGPRPVNFSPSMFGSSSSSMESYFSHERNIGGHCIGCQYHRQTTLTRDHHRRKVSGFDSTSRPNEAACACANRESITEPAGGSSLGLMSGLMRIERIAKRDVLLACTIKLDPLEHLEQQQRQSNILAAGEPQKKANSRPLAAQLGSSNCVSGRLMALRESTTAAEAHREQQAADLSSSSRLFGKSSFSRLRACRSLITLYGRRKKRPNIPVSMLTTSSRQPIPFGPAERRPLAEADETKRRENQTSSSKKLEAGFVDPAASLTTCNKHGEGRELIVMVEFDCSDSELRFVRTFVDSSLPTSTIPDLVLNRIEFCHRNSSDWERQLKLSHRTLSHDFDCYKRQLIEQQREEQHRFQVQRCLLLESRHNNQAARQQTFSFVHRNNHHHGRDDSMLQSHAVAAYQQQQQQQQPILVRSRNAQDNVLREDPAALRFVVAKGGRAISHSNHMIAKSRRPGGELAPAGDGGATCADSTASSRSSSGVSSSGDRNQQQQRISSSCCRRAVGVGGGKSNSLIMLNSDQASERRGQSQAAERRFGASSTFSGSTATSSSLTSSSSTPPAPASCASSLATSSQASLAPGEAAASSPASSSGRLLRLVNRILPGRSSMAGGGGGGGGKIMDNHPEPEERPKVIKPASSLSESASTLMNSQKIHRRLLRVGASRGARERPPAAADRSTSRQGDESRTATRPERHNEHNDDESGSHLYESLEKISEQTAAAAHEKSNSNGFHRQPPGGASVDCRARSVAEPTANRSESENSNDDDDDDDWWATAAAVADEGPRTGRAAVKWMILPFKTAGGAFKGRRSQRRRAKRTLERPAEKSAAKIDSGMETMEPVSIEAVEEVLVNSSSCESITSLNYLSAGNRHDDRDDDDDDGMAAVRAHRNHNLYRSNPVLMNDGCRQRQPAQINQQQEQTYVNLQQSRSSFELDSAKQAMQTRRTAAEKSKPLEQLQPISRMERKLLKIRSRRTVAAGAASRGWPEDELPPTMAKDNRSTRYFEEEAAANSGFGCEYDEDGDEAEAELRARSMNLPAADSSDASTRRRRRHLHRARPALGRDSRREAAGQAVARASFEPPSGGHQQEIESAPATTRSLSGAGSQEESESVNSLLTFSQLAEQRSLPVAPRGGATGGRQSDGAVNSLLSGESASGGSLSLDDGDDRQATQNSSSYSSAAASSSSSSSSSLSLLSFGHDCSAGWRPSSLGRRRGQPLANTRAARVGQVTGGEPAAQAN